MLAPISGGRHDKGEIADRFTWATGSVHLPPVPLSAASAFSHGSRYAGHLRQSRAEGPKAADNPHPSHRLRQPPPSPSILSRLPGFPRQQEATGVEVALMLHTWIYK
ncbi:hypothetical protein O3P69_007515 [Scylla paramamosain]|uniref:Uncharacterized protein n=1 Tax=Scylla paramamosain TaxID=85552 RepID=A0AAW0V680_SCYPA